MKKLLFFSVMLTLSTSQAFGQAWVPEPLVIDVQNVVEYAFDGTDIDIPFSQTGKPALIYLVVNTMMDDSEKPVGLTNGFLGWHFVNGIDTTVYVSAGRGYDPGATNMFPWDGQGSEKDMELLVDSGVVAPGTYFFGLIGYDNQSQRELVSDQITMGFASWPQLCKFYPYDETGALRNRPLIMGTQQYKTWGGGDPKFFTTKGTFFKFTVGSDPYDASLIVTTLCFGFMTDDIVPGEQFQLGNPVFDPTDINTFYFPNSKPWEQVSTITKWTFVPGGEAIQDMTWGGFDAVSWSQGGSNDIPAGLLNANDEVMLYSQAGKNPVQFQTERIIGFPWDDPADELFNVLLDEYWMPNVASDTVAQRMSGEAGKITKGYNKWLWGATGEGTCIESIIDIQKLLDGADEPFAADGSGYLVWANSNGDFFVDKNSHEIPENPAQLWACQVWEPRNFETMRKDADPTDMNDFLFCHIEFAGLYTGALFTQDGSGIDLVKFNDNTFAAGGDNDQKHSYGESLDVGGIYDGIYVRNPIQADPSSYNTFYDQTNWIAWDSDSGIITSEPVAVEEDAPASFSVAQNTPNPFNPSTTISFSLTRDGQVTVDVYNIAGQKVDTLVNDFMTAGSHSVVWDASGQAAGVYFYTVTSSDFSRTMKMTLLK
ncbi:T9SS type A sorting domain-containing protein [Candidatus Latescibacterota bacterium]